MKLDLSRLNPNQRQAVEHGIGPMLVLAGAGSGKTNTMAHRMAHLVGVRGVRAHQILGLSFTNKAARELKDRVRKLVTKAAGAQAAKGLTITTFHSLCARLLREFAKEAGYRPDFTIADASDQRDILRTVLKNIRIDERRFDPDVLLFEIGQAKNRFLGPNECEAFFLESGRLSVDYGLAAHAAYTRYQEQLRLLNALDFDDLLFETVRMLESKAQVRTQLNHRFEHILVDEYQDTNPAQFRLLRALTERQQNLCVVGDDDQSIYAWRGADASHILQFTRQFAGARLITLDQNYRSTETILKAANAVIAENPHRHPKQLWSDKGLGEPLQEVALEDDRDEADWVAETIASLQREQGLPWTEFAILYRSNTQARVFEEALRRNLVPYKIVGGMSFLDRKEVKDILAYLRLVVNPSDDASLRRIIQWPARGIGKSAIELLNAHAFAAGIPLFDALADAPQIAPRAAAGAQALRNTVQGLRQDLETRAVSAVEIAAWGRSLLERVGVKAALEAESEKPEEFVRKWESVEEVIHSLGQYQDEGAGADAVTWVREYLAKMVLDAKEEEEDRKEADDQRAKNQVTLLTLHGAKGLEFPRVFLVGVEEGFLPHRRTIEEAKDFSEERRLCYVGITRAKTHLVITRTKQRIRYGKPVPRLRSRFLEAIPPELLVRRDESRTPDLSTKEAQEKHETKVKDFLSQIRANLTR